MNVQTYVNEKREIQTALLNYLESESNDIEIFHKFTSEIESQNILDNQEEFRALIYLISNISKNHHRDNKFFSNIEHILLHFQDKIKQTFSNQEIFDFFKKNKRVLLFLFTKEIITIDEQIAQYILSKGLNYHCYFFNELKNSISEEKSKAIEKEINCLSSNGFDNFEKNRQIGENDSYICQLIRGDLVEEFVSYVNQANYKLCSTIKPSLFETNSFLTTKEPTLIEYSAFFGSIQILKFLQMNGIELQPSLWLYAIHGNNPNIIHLLEENNVEPADKTYEECLRESVKCHHNNIAEYIISNYLDQEKENKNLEDNYSMNLLSYSFHHYNYYYFPNEFDNKFIIVYLCQYNYTKLVNLLLDSRNIDPNITVILNQKCIYNWILNHLFIQF